MKKNIHKYDKSVTVFLLLSNINKKEGKPFLPIMWDLVTTVTSTSGLGNVS